MGGVLIKFFRSRMSGFVTDVSIKLRINSCRSYSLCCWEDQSRSRASSDIRHVSLQASEGGEVLNIWYQSPPLLGRGQIYWHSVCLIFPFLPHLKPFVLHALICIKLLLTQLVQLCAYFPGRGEYTSLWTMYLVIIVKNIFRLSWYWLYTADNKGNVFVCSSVRSSSVDSCF